MSWTEKWNDIACIHKMCLVNWSVKEAIPGRHDCDLHRLRNADLDSLVKPILNNSAMAIRIVPWDDGMSIPCFICTLTDSHTDDKALDINDPHLASVALVKDTEGNALRVVRDSKLYRRSIKVPPKTKESKRTAKTEPSVSLDSGSESDPELPRKILPLPRRNIDHSLPVSANPRPLKRPRPDDFCTDSNRPRRPVHHQVVRQPSQQSGRLRVIQEDSYLDSDDVAPARHVWNELNDVRSARRDYNMEDAAPVRRMRYADDVRPARREYDTEDVAPARRSHNANDIRPGRREYDMEDMMSTTHRYHAANHPSSSTTRHVRESSDTGEWQCRTSSLPTRHSGHQNASASSSKPDLPPAHRYQHSKRHRDQPTSHVPPRDYSPELSQADMQAHSEEESNFYYAKSMGGRVHKMPRNI